MAQKSTDKVKPVFTEGENDDSDPLADHECHTASREPDSSCFVLLQAYLICF